jgi:MFS family permease
MQVATIQWHIYELTHSALALGAIGLSRFVPIVLFSLVGGTVADVHDRRRIMFVTQTVLALGALTLGILTARGAITAASIYLINAVSASATAFDNPARQSLIPNLVPREHFPNAASLNSMAMQVASITGPLISGVLIGGKALAVIYFLNAFSFCAVMVGLLYVRPRPTSSNPTTRAEVSVASLLEGLRFVRRTPILVWTIVLDFLATFFAAADALLPAIAKDILRLDARGYGWLKSAEAIGSLTAGVVMSARKPVHQQGLTVLWAVVAFGIATVVFGASNVLWLSWLAYAAIGASDTVSTILRQTIRQLVTPDHLRGRMTAVNMIFFMGGPQLGNLESGVAAHFLGAPLAIVSGGLACLLAVGWVATRASSLRGYVGQEPGRMSEN